MARCLDQIAFAVIMHRVNKLHFFQYQYSILDIWYVIK